MGTTRGLNVLLGAWLFISAFVWPHGTAEMTNTWILGVIITVVAALSFKVAPLRYVNTLAAIWLFIASLALPHAHAATPWNNCIVAIVVFLASLAPSGGTHGHFFDRPART
ncbi:MAG TPA: SPW repeat protein [Polyangiaceae bacterium]|jgi:hypothetical protein